MKLDLFNNLTNQIQRNEDIQNFMKELQDFFMKAINENDNINILDKIEKERNISLISKNKISNKKDEILSKYADEMKEYLYFISNKTNTEGTYKIEKYSNDKKEILQVPKEELPEDMKINIVLKKENEKYVIDEAITKNVISEITESAKQILDDQDKKLEEYKKEGNLYLITEDRNDRIYIWDLTTKPKIEIEDVNFPKELRNDVGEGTILQYRNGEYKIHSNDETM